MGFFICFQALKKEKKVVKNNIKKTYSFFIKFLGITIKIIKNPTSSDLDKSKKIDGKEALFLSLALSIDTICIGIGGSIVGINNLIFPFLISFFQIFFLELGSFLGKKLNYFSNLPTNIWSVVSGILLILLGIIKIIF